MKTGKNEVYYLAMDNNPAIISKEFFEAVQLERVRRGNVVVRVDGKLRKNKKYSSKRR